MGKWGDQFGIYLHMNLSGRGCQDDDNNDEVGVGTAAFSEASSRDVADALCDDLIRFGNPHFRHTIDCAIEYLTKEDYTQALLTINNEHQDKHQDEIEIEEAATHDANTDTDTDIDVNKDSSIITSDA